MKKCLFSIAGSLLLTVSASAQTPAIGTGGVLPAATYVPAGLPNAGIAPGSYFTVFGTDMGPSATAGATAGQPFPTTLGGSAVTFTVGSTTKSALLYYVSPTQINGVLPSDTPTGAATVTVSYNGATSASAPATVVTSNFGTFTQNAVGTGPASVQNFSQSYQLVTLTGTMKPGDVGILYGTGLGANPGGDQDDTGQSLNFPSDLRSSLDFHLYLGLEEITSGVSFAGRSQFVGLDQINFTVPNDAQNGCFVPLVVRVGSVVSNFGTISIDAGGGTCSDPYGLTPDQISKASTGKFSVASLLLTRLSIDIGIAPITEDDASGRFYEFDGSSYATSPEHSPDFIGISSFGSCAITTCANTSTCIPSSQSLNLPHLDAGANLSVSGNGAPTTSVPKQSNGFYSAPLASNPVVLPGYPTPAFDFLKAGTFSFTGPGGADINAFTASIPVPAVAGPKSYSQTFNTSTPLNRSQDLTVTWDAGSSSDYRLISIGSATNVGTVPSGQTNASTITCLQRADTGSLTVPSWLLQALPVSSSISIGPLTNQPGGAVLFGTFNVSNTFSSNADLSVANSIVLSGINTNLQ